MNLELDGSASGVEKAIQTAVRMYGRSSLSFDALAAPEKYQWFLSDCSEGGGVAYRRIGGCYVVMGDPLVEREKMLDVARQFIGSLSKRSCVLFFSASHEFMKASVENGASAALLTGEIEFNPQNWIARGRRASKLRQNVRHMQRRGIKAVEVKPDAPDFEDYLNSSEILIRNWLNYSVKRPGHVHEVNLRRELKQKRYFFASDPEDAKNPVSMLLAWPLYARNGFYLFTCRRPNSPTGANEIVIMKAIETFREEGIDYLTFGPQPQIERCLYMGQSALMHFFFENAYPRIMNFKGYGDTGRFYHKFGFGKRPPGYALIWPKNAFFRPLISIVRTTNAL